MEEFEVQSNTNHAWQDSVEPGLVRQLMRPMVQPGVIGGQLAGAILSRTQEMAVGLPLLADLVKRHGTTQDFRAGQMPIVYAVPRPDELGRPGEMTGLSVAREGKFDVPQSKRPSAQGKVVQRSIDAKLKTARASEAPSILDQPPSSDANAQRGRPWGAVPSEVERPIVQAGKAAPTGAANQPSRLLVQRAEGDGPLAGHQGETARQAASLVASAEAAGKRGASPDMESPPSPRPVVQPVARRRRASGQWVQREPSPALTGTRRADKPSSGLPLVFPQPPVRPGGGRPGAGWKGQDLAPGQGALGARVSQPTTATGLVQRTPSDLNASPPTSPNGSHQITPAVAPDADGETRIDLRELAERVKDEMDMEEVVEKVQRQLRQRFVVESERRGWVQWP
jgi:hypothetical protein